MKLNKLQKIRTGFSPLRVFCMLYPRNSFKAMSKIAPGNPNIPIVRAVPTFNPI